MKLSNSQKRNINCIALYCLNEKNKSYIISNVSEFKDQIQVSFIRRISITELEKINSYLESNLKNKQLVYKFIITPSSCEILLDQPEFNQISLFDNNYNEDKLIAYNKSINNRLNAVKELLINTFFDDDFLEHDWIYFFVASSYIGYANGDLNSNKCIRGTTLGIPNNAYKLKGTYNDSKCVLLRRNQNSNCFGNWNVSPNDVKCLQELVNCIQNYQ